VQDDSSLKTEKHFLFHYATKMLVERISWYADDNKPKGQTGHTKLIFSQRRQLKLERLNEHFRKLYQAHQEGMPNSSIRWNVLDRSLVEIKDHDSLPGLQVADAAVSSVAQAVELSPYDTTEHRYVKMWREHYYRSGQRCQGYGLKIFPKLPNDLPWDANRFHWLHHFK
jgi:hypothetical protein